MDLLGERTMKSKFKEYFILNIKFVKKELLYMAFVGIALGVMEKVWPDVWSFGPTTLIIPLFIGAIPVFSILYVKIFIFLFSLKYLEHFYILLQFHLYYFFLLQKRNSQVYLIHFYLIFLYFYFLYIVLILL